MNFSFAMIRLRSRCLLVVVLITAIASSLVTADECRCDEVNNSTLSTPKKLQFVHVPKTGGETIEDFLGVNKSHQYAYLECLVQLGRFREYGKIPCPRDPQRVRFSIVRNPFDRMWSWFRFCLHGYRGRTTGPAEVKCKNGAVRPFREAMLSLLNETDVDALVAAEAHWQQQQQQRQQQEKELQQQMRHTRVLYDMPKNSSNSETTITSPQSSASASASSTTTTTTTTVSNHPAAPCTVEEAERFLLEKHQLFDAAVLSIRDIFLYWLQISKESHEAEFLAKPVLGAYEVDWQLSPPMFNTAVCWGTQYDYLYDIVTKELVVDYVFRFENIFRNIDDDAEADEHREDDDDEHSRDSTEKYVCGPGSFAQMLCETGHADKFENATKINRLHDNDSSVGGGDDTDNDNDNHDNKNSNNDISSSSKRHRRHKRDAFFSSTLTTTELCEIERRHPTRLLLMQQRQLQQQQIQENNRGERNGEGNSGTTGILNVNAATTTTDATTAIGSGNENSIGDSNGNTIDARAFHKGSIGEPKAGWHKSGPVLLRRDWLYFIEAASELFEATQRRRQQQPPEQRQEQQQQQLQQQQQGASPTAGREASTSRESRVYREWYSAEAREFVQKHFQQDLDAFQYEF